jgi:hypothetical protein
VATAGLLGNFLFGVTPTDDHSGIGQKKAVGKGEPDCPVFMSGTQKKEERLVVSIA